LGPPLIQLSADHDADGDLPVLRRSGLKLGVGEKKKKKLEHLSIKPLSTTCEMPILLPPARRKAYRCIHCEFFGKYDAVVKHEATCATKESLLCPVEWTPDNVAQNMWEDETRRDASICGRRVWTCRLFGLLSLVLFLWALPSVVHLAAYYDPCGFAPGVVPDTPEDTHFKCHHHRAGNDDDDDDMSHAPGFISNQGECASQSLSGVSCFCETPEGGGTKRILKVESLSFHLIVSLL
jgi:hypothetical protein